MKQYDDRFALPWVTISCVYGLIKSKTFPSAPGWNCRYLNKILDDDGNQKIGETDVFRTSLLMNSLVSIDPGFAA